MNTKRFVTLILIAIVSIAFTAPASWAGSAGAHRIEGAMIGIGALILTKAIIDSQHDAYATAPRHTAAANYHRRPSRPAGYWEVQKAWVPGQYEKVWNPGHYDRRGAWIAGHWQRLEIEPGYWTEQRVWVPCN